MGARHNLERYGADDLYSFLTTACGGSVVAETKSHLTIRLPNGVEVPCPDPIGRFRGVSAVIANRVGTNMGHDLFWLRDQVKEHRRSLRVR